MNNSKTNALSGRIDVQRSDENGRGESGNGTIELSEKGRNGDGEVVALDRRLFMQFTAYSGIDVDKLIGEFKSAGAQAVVYDDVNDLFGVGVMTFCECANYVLDVINPIVRSVIHSQSNGRAIQRTDLTMLGRTYSIGYENNLVDVLLERPIKRVCDSATPWAVYYPVRRSGMFERQPREEQRKMLMEHGGIGHAFGKAGFATDIRLASHGLNTDDNDFVVGLLGKELFPLSALVQRMRKTRQTSEFIQSMGPFFIGKAMYQPEFSSLNEIR